MKHPVIYLSIILELTLLGIAVFYLASGQLKDLPFFVVYCVALTGVNCCATLIKLSKYFN